MLTAFIIFMSGAITFRVLQFFLGINPNYYIFKHTEHTSLTILSEVYLTQYSVIKLMEISMKEAGESEEVIENTKTALNERYTELINRSVLNLKSRLPYKVEYNSLKEAVEYYYNTKKEIANE